MGPRNAYKDMLDNVVSPITCVSNESPKSTRTNGKWGHVRYTRERETFLRGTRGKVLWFVVSAVLRAYLSLRLLSCSME
jgi:hypothetical protein